ncbi:HET-domain-containing protein, partial [Decorospora gaudefroyi]
MSKPYSYGALPDSSRWIRLLILAPGTFNAPLSIRLKNTNLDAVDAYTALSWRWSKPTETTTLKVDQDETLTISQNLESALQALRDETENVVLWVDQVCINQMDSTEKLLQIPLMGKIYSKARSTVGWLG